MLKTLWTSEQLTYVEIVKQSVTKSLKDAYQISFK